MNETQTPQREALRALIIDDEPLAREHIKRMLQEQDVNVIAEGEGADDALNLSEELLPDVVFLDIHMPGLDGLEVADALAGLPTSPQVVFVTGYSEHAIKAFEKGALDYLLKPVAADRLQSTLARVKEKIKDTRARARLRSAQIEAISTQSARYRRLPVRETDSVRLLRIDRIICAIARDKHVFIRTREGENKTYYSLTQLESLLPPYRFMRIHASCIVDIDQIEQLLFLGNHSYGVKLANGMELPVGRAAYPLLKQRLGLDLISNKK